MSRKLTLQITVLGVLVLVAGVVLATLFAVGRPAGNPAAELAIISATAVGIERVLELFWEVAGQLRSAWWPLDVPAQRLDAFVGSLNQVLKPYLASANEVLSKAGPAAGEVPQELQNARTLLAQVEQFVAGISVASPPTEAEAAATIAAIDRLQSAFPAAQDLAAKAKSTLSDLASFASAFVNNPARKLISLYAGAVIGVAIATFTGLDLFAASGVTLSLHLGVAITGVVMGLGSNPTHEVIKAVQEYKNRQRRG